MFDASLVIIMIIIIIIIIIINSLLKVDKNLQTFYNNQLNIN